MSHVGNRPRDTDNRDVFLDKFREMKRAEMLGLIGRLDGAVREMRDRFEKRAGRLPLGDHTALDVQLERIEGVVESLLLCVGEQQ